MQSIVLLAALLSTAVNGSLLPRTALLPRADDPNCATLPCGSTKLDKYTVKPGDTLKGIADQYNSGICDIAKYNQIQDPNVIKPGQVLQIPEKCTSPDNTSCVKATPKYKDTCVPGLPGSYTVRKGDNLGDVASNFKITLDALEKANTQIKNYNSIDIGQIINIPVCANSECATVGTYIIKENDIFYELADTYHTSVGQIEALNENVDPTKLQIGQQIVLPQNCQLRD